MSRSSPSGDNGMVVCAVHQSSRNASYCEEVNIYDADQNVVGVQHRCKRDHQCTNRRQQGNVDGPYSALDGSSMAVQPDAPHSLGTMGIAFTADTKDTPDTSEPRGRATGLGGQRYYDMMEKGQQGGSIQPQRKVCWNCGLTGHEKPDCTNGLCRTCHSKKAGPGRPHSCANVAESPFIMTLEKLPRQLAQVRCVYCGENGHLDCGPVRDPCPPSELSCCYCAERGHTAFDCGLRESQNGDRWLQRMLRRGHSSYDRNTRSPFQPQGSRPHYMNSGSYGRPSPTSSSYASSHSHRSQQGSESGYSHHPHWQGGGSEKRGREGRGDYYSHNGRDRNRERDRRTPSSRPRVDRREDLY